MIVTLAPACNSSRLDANAQSADARGRTLLSENAVASCRADLRLPGDIS